MDSNGLLNSLFGVPRALIGVIHVGALPGTPANRLAVPAIAEQAVTEARAYEAAGFHGLLIENTHDRPYLKISVGPEIGAAMAVIGAEVRRAARLPLGIQVLAGANLCALAVAHACGAAFIRVEGFVFAHVADEGLIESTAGALLRYRKAIGADPVRIFADIKKKHSAHAITADVDIVETAKAAEFFQADGVVVSGAATGRAADPGEVRAVSCRGHSHARWFGHHAGKHWAIRPGRRLDRWFVGQAGWPLVKSPRPPARPCRGPRVPVATGSSRAMTAFSKNSSPPYQQLPASPA
jgi:membrane complex biogenesis BtpA family protein